MDWLAYALFDCTWLIGCQQVLNKRLSKTEGRKFLSIPFIVDLLIAVLVPPNVSMKCKFMPYLLLSIRACPGDEMTS